MTAIDTTFKGYKEENLSEKIGYVDSWQIRNNKTDVHPSHPQGIFEEEDVKEKIQNAQRRLKEKLKFYKMKITLNNKSMILREHEKNEIIDKIFLEEFGKDLIK